MGSLKDIEPEGEAPAWKKSDEQAEGFSQEGTSSKAEEFEEAEQLQFLGIRLPYWMSYHGTLQLEKRLRNVPCEID
ncbi:hypothetical protein P7H15_11805 [Paenibacillus larvae]|nr:hypothetical protein [Paenibacillus larvae]MDT2293384.1 hypothetical protein [Paenibacillus larvae]